MAPGALRFGTLAACLLMLSTGCTPETSPPAAAVPAPASDKTLQPAAAPALPLRIADWAAVEAEVARHKGQVIVVDLWTTTCRTCVEHFPHFVDLHRRLGSQGVTVIAVNCDYDGIADKPPDFYRVQVEKFLREQQTSFDNILLNVPLIDLLEQLKLASTPAVFVYAPDGRLSKRFDNDNSRSEQDDFQPADVERLVQELNAGKGG